MLGSTAWLHLKQRRGGQEVVEKSLDSVVAPSYIGGQELLRGDGTHWLH